MCFLHAQRLPHLLNQVYNPCLRTYVSSRFEGHLPGRELFTLFFLVRFTKTSPPGTHYSPHLPGRLRLPYILMYISSLGRLSCVVWLVT
jgi:hypothetical protein